MTGKVTLYSDTVYISSPMVFNRQQLHVGDLVSMKKSHIRIAILARKDGKRAVHSGSRYQINSNFLVRRTVLHHAE